MRKRLRGAYSDEDLKIVYSTPHVHSGWVDHRQRVRSTIALAGWFENVRSIADLSCGDGAIIDALNVPTKYKGDFAPKYDIHGAMEETLLQIPHVDLLIMSETIEHLDDPDLVLRMAREKAKYLILSTPNGEDNDGNPQHYWGWDDKDIRAMLIEAGWLPVIYSSLEFADANLIYDYQLWGCA